ncbi:transcriptional repressor AgaR [Parafilimonas sp.]|uniref:transcriptional repressor AgaR n=1 Tax=Parafilimonas sp. TaxID=1969739 RepID=UPI003F7E4BBE
MAERKERFTVSRRKKILEHIKETGEVMVTQLSKEFNVSEVTIRNDLEHLERKNLLVRARGGAIHTENHVGIDQRITEKHKIHAAEKAAIGKLASSLINDGETIIIDSGTTTAEIVKHLDGIKHLNVITNALNIANLLAAHPAVNVIIPGGYLRQNAMSLVGPLAEKNLRNFFVDKVFLSTDGFDTKQGIFTPNIDEAHLNGIMIEIAKEVILVTDSSKFKRKSLAFICGLDKIKKVVTDNGIAIDDKKRLEEAGIEVLVAG